MKSLILAFALLGTVLATSLTTTTAFAKTHSKATVKVLPYGQPCAFSRDADVCAARSACPANPRSARCATYCHVNTRDTLCYDTYMPKLPHVYPGTDSPYPWARSGGGFCTQNPGNIACQNDWNNWGW